MARAEEIVLRVANSTDMHKLAASIQGYLEEGKTVVLSCIGVQPVNQAVKAVIKVTGMLAAEGSYLTLLPFWYMERQDENLEKNVLRFRVICLRLGVE